MEQPFIVQCGGEATEVKGCCLRGLDQALMSYREGKRRFQKVGASQESEISNMQMSHPSLVSPQWHWGSSRPWMSRVSQKGLIVWKAGLCQGVSTCFPEVIRNDFLPNMHKTNIVCVYWIKAVLLWLDFSAPHFQSQLAYECAMAPLQQGFEPSLSSLHII